MLDGSIKPSVGTAKTTRSAISKVTGEGQASNEKNTTISTLVQDGSKLAALRPGSLTEEITNQKNDSGNSENKNDKGEVAKSNQNDSRTFTNSREIENQVLINNLWSKNGALSGLKSNLFKGAYDIGSYTSLSGGSSIASPSATGLTGGASNKAGLTSSSATSSDGASGGLHYTRAIGGSHGGGSGGSGGSYEGNLGGGGAIQEGLNFGPGGSIGEGGSNGSNSGNSHRGGNQSVNFAGEVKLDEKDKGKADFANWNTTKSESVGLMDHRGNELSQHINREFVKGNKSLGEAYNEANGKTLLNFYDNGVKNDLTMTTGEKKLPDNFGSKENPADVAFIFASTGGGQDGHMFAADVENSKAIALKAGVKAEDIHVVKDFNDFLEKRDQIIEANKDAVTKGEDASIKNALVFQFNHGNLSGRDVSDPGGDGSHNLKDKSYFSFNSGNGKEEVIKEDAFEPALAKLQEYLPGDLLCMNGSCHSGGLDGDPEDNGIKNENGSMLAEIKNNKEDESMLAENKNNENTNNADNNNANTDSNSKPPEEKVA